jgi:NAD(P)-dependent dehydrogenase (short-subunit alcohol dehydrogenase family)
MIWSQAESGPYQNGTTIPVIQEQQQIMQLAGKVALVTGAGAGIGRATALTLAKEGAKVAVLELLPHRAQEVAAEIHAAGGEALSLVADVAQADQMQTAIRRVVEQWDRLDIVFANAGINGVWAPLEELTAEEWDRTIDVNLKGCFLTIKYATPWLKKQGGAIVVTSSVNGTRVFSNSGAVAYSCARPDNWSWPKCWRRNWPRMAYASTPSVPVGSKPVLAKTPSNATATAFGGRRNFPMGPFR